jgi:N-acetyl-anhydromuramyl-L-alanine amidase AmpD
MLDIDGTTHRAKAQRARPGNIPPNAIVLHSGEGDSAANDIDALTHTTSSSHYYVTRKGKIFQFVDDARRASHTGPTRFLGETDWNDFSLGIETEHNKKQNWPQVQLDAIAELTKQLIEKHGVLRERVVAHRWIRRPASEDHQDPTNFPDPKLRRFITDLYPKTGRGELFRVTTDDTNVRRAASFEDDPIAKLNQDDVIEVEGEVQGASVKGSDRWKKRVKGQGFVHSSLLEPAKIA